MKWLKRIGIVIICLPLILMAGIIVYEIFGMCVNHAATDRQTGELQADLESAIPDIEIIHGRSETGNASGTGNHVECVSAITFSTGMTEEEIEGVMSEYFNSVSGYCSLGRTDEGLYSFYMETEAPFPSNIEGH